MNSEDSRARSVFDLILSDGFPCLGARRSARRGECETATYDRIDADDEALAELGANLNDFIRRRSEPRSAFAVHVAIEANFTPSSETEFEHYLWTVLRRLNESDVKSWDCRYSTDPDDVSFKFSFGGRAFYVVGLSPAASRRARRFPVTALVFNPVWQFERLRDLGRLEPLIHRIRGRDVDYDGSINPNLEFEGVLSDALQYSGRAVGSDWQCPQAAWRHCQS